MALISDRLAEVRYGLGNRNDIDLRIKNWIAEAYLELASNYPFEELEDTVNDMMVATIDNYQYPATARAIKALTLVIPNSNGQTRPMWRKHIRNIRRYPTTGGGDPAVYAPFKNLIYVRPVPRKSYDFIWDIWVKPIIDYSAGAGDPASTQLLLPDDWLEILDLCAILRGHIKLLERDKAAEVHTLLYGGVDEEGRHTPGLIKAKLLRKAAENVDSEFAMRPRIRRYTSVA